ncbi:MAG: c-type cytochrome domain-containing protein, partial [Bacteroidota bacterium]
MRVLEKISINLAFGLVILLLFLSIISATPVVPEWLQVFGRMHMLLLHLPIGIWAVLLVLAIFTPPQGAAASARSFRLLLALAVLTGAASAFMGFVLATEGGYTADALQNHRLGGIAIAVLGLVFWMGYTWRPMPLVWLRGGLLAMLIVITLTGHWGANLTHGADFVWAPLQTEPTEETALSDTLFLAHIQPLLEEKCVSCHNDNKQKGELNMTTFALLEKGGENGPIWNTVAPSQSAMLVRAHLPLEHEEHMPPEGKPQLTAAEINLLQAWRTAGASSSQTISSLDENAPLALAVNAILPATSNQAYDLPAADPQVVATLNSPFMQVRSVGPGSNGLEAKFFIRKNYDPVRLQNLIKIAPQLVGLDLSNMPVKDEELAGVAQFPELRTLLLNGTNISNEGLVALQGLTKLERVGLVGIPVSSEATAEIAQLPALKSIYLWDTPLQREDFAALAKIHPQIHFDRGYQPDTSEMLKLSPPALKGDKVGIYPYGEMLTLKSFFPG